MKLLYIIILVFLLLPSVVFGTDVTEVQNRIDNVAGASPVGTPTAPTGMDQKGYIGMIIGRLFETTGMIKTAFLIPFQTIYNTQINTLPRWNGQSFTLGSIRDNGSNVGIGTGTLNNRRVNIAGDINFSGDLYKNGTLFNPTPTNVVYTIGSQDISGVKTFINSPTIKNISPTSYFLDTDHRSAMLHVNNNNFYVLRGDGNGSINWSQYNGRWPLQINLENNDATFGGSGDFNGNLNIGLADSTARLLNIAGGTTGTTEGGEIRIQTAGDYDSPYNYYFIDAYQDNLRIGRAGIGNDFILNSSGNLGIGNSTPAQKLTVGGNISSRSTNPQIFLQETDRIGVSGNRGWWSMKTNNDIFTITSRGYDSDTGSSNEFTSLELRGGEMRVWGNIRSGVNNSERITASTIIGRDNTSNATTGQITGNIILGDTNQLNIPTVTSGYGGNNYIIGRSNHLMWGGNSMVFGLGNTVNSVNSITVGSFLTNTIAGSTMIGNGSGNILVAANGNIGVSTTAPTQKLDVNGKIRMRTQTVATDSADTVVTKGYLESKSVTFSQVQKFDLQGNGGETSKTLSLGTNWSICTLSGYRTWADDNNVQDSCDVLNVGGNWKLDLLKHSEDSLRCSATCFR